MPRIVAVAILAAAAACVAPVEVPPAAIPVELAGLEMGAAQARVTVDSARRLVVVYAGPYHVPAAEAGHHDLPHDMVGHTERLVEFDWPIEGWLRGFMISLHDETGRELPRDLMHHLIGYNLDRRPLIHPGVERLFGAGLETKDVIVPEALGVPVRLGSNLGFHPTWHNETGADIHGVFVRVVLPYTPYRPEGVRIEGLPFHAEVNFSVNASTAFDLPPGRSEHTFEFEVPLAGGIIGAGGHMHDYGIAMRLEDLDAGRTLFVLRGKRDRDGKLLAMEQRVFRKWFNLKDARVRLEPGRRYRVVGEYDNPTGETIPFGAMAHIVGMFAPDDLSHWPDLDRDDPIVRLDVAVLRGEIPRGTGAPSHVHEH